MLFYIYICFVYKYIAYKEIRKKGSISTVKSVYNKKVKIP